MIPRRGATTTLTVKRVTTTDASGGEWFASYGMVAVEAPSERVLTASLRAHISILGRRGDTDRFGGLAQVGDFHITSDPFDFFTQDVLVDNKTGDEFVLVTAYRNEAIRRFAHCSILARRSIGMAA